MENNKEIKALAVNYIDKGQIIDFSQIPEYQKLAVLQITPRKYIKTVKKGKNDMVYLPHTYTKAALNFIFNFNVSVEIIKAEYLEYTEDYWDFSDKSRVDPSGRVTPVKKQRKVIEAESHVRFTFGLNNGNKIIRDVYSSHKGFSNPATTRGDIMKAALSKAWTVVAGTFGIDTDAKLAISTKDDIDVTPPPVPTQKNFDIPY